MSKLYHLEIITPERQFFNDKVESVVFDTPEGKRGVMADHTPMVIALTVGEIDIKHDDQWKKCFTSEGFIEIRPDKTLILAQTVEWPEEIDIRRAEEAKRRAEERLRQRQSLQEYHSTMSSLARAMARLRIKRSMNID